MAIKDEQPNLINRKVLESFNELETRYFDKNVSLLKYGDDWTQVRIREIKQALTVPTSDEIVEELNRETDYEWNYKDDIYPIFQSNNPEIFIELDDKMLGLSLETETAFVILSLSTVNKITTFFLNQSEVE